MRCAILTLILICASLSADVKFERVPEGGIQPQIAQEENGTVHMIFYKGDPLGGNIYYVQRKIGDAGFSKPIRVNQREGSAIAAGTIRGPQLALGKDGRVHVAWMGGKGAQKVNLGGTEATPMMYARMADDRAEFEPEKAVNVKVSGLDGGGSLAADAHGNVWVIWHGMPPGVTGEENRLLYVARSADEGKTFAEEFAPRTPSPGACACCGMKAFATEKGELYVMFRNLEESTRRPELLLVSKDQGKSFNTVISEMWEISTCPMSSASIQRTKGGILSAWETKGNVQIATIINGKEQKSFSPPPGPKRKYPFALDNGKGETLLTWVEDAGWGTTGKLGWEIYPRKTNGKAGNRETRPWSFAQAYVANGDFVIVY